MKEEKIYCSGDVCDESQLRFDFESLLCCQCDDEDECVVLKGRTAILYLVQVGNRILRGLQIVDQAVA